MPSQPMFDVVVVGARAAGAATAMLLARAGLSVLLLDRDRPGADTLSTHALMRGAVVQLKRWGLLDRIVGAGTPPILQTTFHYSASDITVGIKPAAGVDALYAPRRTVLDPVLVAAAREAGVVVRHGVSVVGVLRRGGRVAGVRICDHARRSDDLPARLVVGADGRRSTIARLVDAATTHRVRHTSAFVYGYFRGLGVSGYEWAYRPGGTAGFIPTNDQLTCVFGGHLPSHIGRGGPAVLHRTVELADPGMGERLRSGELVSPGTYLHRPARPPAPAMGTRLDAGRRRRLVEGPDQCARTHRRAARRRARRQGSHPDAHRRTGRG